MCLDHLMASRGCLLVMLIISEVEADSRRIVEKHQIIWHNVTKNDATVIQCNATNDHGYIYTNAYLNVLSKYNMFLFDLDLPTFALFVIAHLKKKLFANDSH